MKKKFKVVLYVITCCIVLLCISIYFYIQSVKSNLKNLETNVNNRWSEYFQLSTERINATSVFINHWNYNIPNKNEIIQEIKNNLSVRDNYKEECNLNYIKLEYDLNKKVMRLLDSIDYELDIYKTFKTTLETSNSKINILISEYNNSVMNYNMFRSTFPIFLIAQKNGYKRKKHFTIQYGINNEDPIVKSKELPKWAAGVDTTL